jgi:hypothetical protein
VSAVPRTSGRQWPSWGSAIAILLSGIAFSIPLWLHTGEVSLGADIEHHLPWSEHFAQQLWSGELYPRWIEAANDGLGSPTFFFYPPLPFYISSLWHPLTAISGTPWFAIAAAATLAMVASGFSAFAWLRAFANPRVSLIGAVFYMAIPFHLGADLYARFVYAELWGLVWTPLVLLASRPAPAGTPTLATALRTCVAVAAPYALLALSHLPTLLLFSALPVLQAMVLPSKERRLHHVAGVLSGMVLGFAMAAAFVAPAWADRAHASMEEIATGWAFYDLHFLVDGAGDWFSRGLDLWICLVLAFTVYAALFFRRQARSLDRETWLWLLVALGSVVITTRLATPVWKYMPLIKTVQFPWRFGTVSTLAVTALAALMLSRAQTRGSNIRAVVAEHVTSWKSAAILAASFVAFAGLVYKYAGSMMQYPVPWFGISVASLALVWSLQYGFGWPFGRNDHRAMLGAWLAGGFLLLANIPPMIPIATWHLETLRHRDHAPDPTRDESMAALAISMDPPEYRIRTVSPDNYTADHMSGLRSTLQAVTVMSGSGSVAMTGVSARRSVLDVDAATPVSILLRRYYYPGTTVLDSAGQPLGKVTASRDEGLAWAELPAGRYRAELVLARGRNEQLGLWISGAAIALWIGLALAVRTRRPA